MVAGINKISFLHRAKKSAAFGPVILKAKVQAEWRPKFALDTGILDVFTGWAFEVCALNCVLSD